jgi:alkaline phosphatase D
VVSRREWLQLSLALGAQAALGACGRDSGPPEPELAPVSDVVAATFEVTATGALVAVHSQTATSATVRVEDVETGGMRVTEPQPLAAEVGFTAAFELAGLSPGRRYRHSVHLDNNTRSQWYEFTTAPDPAEPADVTFLVSADLDSNIQFYSPIYESMSASHADFFVSLGDWPYADNPPGAWTIDEYRAKHRKARSFDRVQQLLASMPVYAIYDDHEARNDWDGHFTQTEAERIANALVVWDEWFPLRGRATPSERKRYRDWRWGRDAHFFLLDTRRYRSANPASDGPHKTMLGAEQRNWLINGVTNSDAAFKIVLTSVPLDFGYTHDSWPAFRHERDTILNCIRGAQTSGVLFLAGDQHWFAVHKLANGFRQFQLGPVSRGIPELPEDPPEVALRVPVYNYGEIAISRDGQAPKLTVTGRNEAGLPLYTESFSPQDLLPQPLSADQHRGSCSAYSYELAPE